MSDVVTVSDLYHQDALVMRVTSCTQFTWQQEYQDRFRTCCVKNASTLAADSLLFVAVKRQCDMEMLPLECHYLNKSALISVVGQQVTL
jgi:hypothetical protein